jgi:DNA-directed RNA polymerase specialized sigma24 family protein
LARLRERFLAVARKRVPEAVVEDVVQEALGIVYEKGIAQRRAEEVEGLPALAWCFQVLRYRVGSHYQKARVRTHAPLEALEAGASPLGGAIQTPLESLEADEESRLVREALVELSSNEAACGRYLSRLAAGVRPAALAAEERVTEPILYRRVYRCRAKLRALLERRGFEI